MNNNDYMNKKPYKNVLKWETDRDGIVTLQIENKGLMKRLSGSPRKSTVCLDELGSFVWNHIDGECDILEIGKSLEKQFGEKSKPLYERLIKYFKILKSYRLIDWSR